MGERYTTGKGINSDTIYEDGGFWMTTSSADKAQRIAAALNREARLAAAESLASDVRTETNRHIAELDAEVERLRAK